MVLHYMMFVRLSLLSAYPSTVNDCLCRRPCRRRRRARAEEVEVKEVMSRYGQCRGPRQISR